VVALAAPAWTDEDADRLAKLLEAQHGGEGLDAYIRRVSPRHAPPRHIKPLIDVWEATRHERVFACIELPPRHAKTTTGLHGIAWRLKRDPAVTNAFATFGDDYAASRSRIARVLTRAGGVQLSKDMANLHEWRTTYGGGAICRGYQGEWTGQGITGVGLIDDPFKDRAAAESKKIRENVWEWFTDVWWTRLEPGSSCIVQHTRWHDDDLIGRLLKGRFAGYSFKRIRLPAIAEDDDDILGRFTGEALWPERFTAEELEKIRISIGEYGWASLYQQRPRPKGAEIFYEPSRFSLLSWVPDGHRILVCADPAASESTRADFSALFVLAAKGYGENMTIDVLYGWRGHVSVPKFARKLLEVSRQFWNAPIVVEAVAGFKAVPQTLKEIEPRLKVRAARMGDPTVDQDDNAAKVSNTSVNKFLRSQPAAAAWNVGRIRVPVDAECIWNPQRGRFEMPLIIQSIRAGVAPNVTWADELILEAQNFTGVDDPEDDQVDALAHGFNDLHSSRQGRRGQGQNSNPFG
jgi:hypothetical protein